MHLRTNPSTGPRVHVITALLAIFKMASWSKGWRRFLQTFLGFLNLSKAKWEKWCRNAKLKRIKRCCLQVATFTFSLGQNSLNHEVLPDLKQMFLKVPWWLVKYTLYHWLSCPWKTMRIGQHFLSFCHWYFTPFLHIRQSFSLIFNVESVTLCSTYGWLA